MNPKSFIAFSSVTVILVIAAVVALGSRPTPTKIPTDRKLVFAGVDQRINDVASVEIATPDRTFTVARLGDGWGIKELNGFPAKFDKVKTVLVQLSQLRYLEAKTADPERYARLDLRDLTVKGAKSKRIVVRDKDGKALADGLLGKRNDSLFGSNRGGTYMRIDHKPQTWLVEGVVDVGDGPPDWISRKLTDIKSDVVKSLTVMSPKGGAVVVSRAKASDKDFKLADIPQGKQQRGQWETNQMPKALEGLELVDIRRADEITYPENGTYKGKLETFNGLVVETEAAKIGKKYWVRIAARTTGDDAAAKKTADDINSRLKGYVFEVKEDFGKKLTCEHINMLEGAGIHACT